MTSRISEFDPPRRFMDEMEAGPFASFRHEHLFEPGGPGTRMADVIEFRTRCGPLAPIVDIAAGAYLRRLMRSRNATIRTRAESR